ncbi:MAG: hypothetical protein AAF171_04475 [Cyanobacteria bacterium P01_A01_bin.116]
MPSYISLLASAVPFPVKNNKNKQKKTARETTKINNKKQQEKQQKSEADTVCIKFPNETSSLPAILIA